MKFYLKSLAIEGFKTEKEIQDYCDEFNTCWFNRQFLKLEDQIQYLLKRTVMFQNVTKFTTTVIDSEIPLTLIDIISVFTPDSMNSNPDLFDYVEGGQNILVDSFKALNFILCYSAEDENENENEENKVASLLIDSDIVEIICTNIKKDYSELTRIQALYFLGDIIQYDRGLIRLSQFPDFFKFLLHFLKVDRYSIEKCYAVVDFVSKIAQKSNFKVVDIFTADALDILLYLFESASECIVKATRSLFYLMFYNPKLVFLPLTENVIENTITSENPEVTYFLLQILKLCNIYLPSDRLANIYSQIDFECFNYFLTVNDPLLFSTSNFFITLFDRGSQFIEFAMNNFNDLYQAYQEVPFELKYSILNAFDVAFIKANEDQLSFFLSNDFDFLIFDSIPSHERISLCLDAMIAITNFDQSRIQDHQELINDLEQVEFNDVLRNNRNREGEEEEEENEDEENKQKATYLISIITQSDLKD